MEYKLELRGVNTLVCNYFNVAYPELNKEIYIQGDKVDSRNGMTKEVLSFKTVIKDQTKRCIGGYNRNINIFFLIAEALWIMNGKKDTEFLDIFNSRMKDYSDDGIVFNAPYGFRLRNHGVASDSGESGYDQIKRVLDILEKDDETRQAVASIWNPLLDLTDRKTLDRPCNDLLMWKIRNAKLNITIANRSNDLHWGLTTNVFQFSFLNEIMATCLGLKTGDQVHLSDSLHIYLEKEDCANMISQLQPKCEDIYSYIFPDKMDFNLSENISASRKLSLIDSYIEKMIFNLTLINRGEKVEDNQFLINLNGFSKSFAIFYTLLKMYITYKIALKNSKKEEWDNIRVSFIEMISMINEEKTAKHKDYLLLAMNFFAKRIKNYENISIPGIPSIVGQL